MCGELVRNGAIAGAVMNETDPLGSLLTRKIDSHDARRLCQIVPTVSQNAVRYASEIFGCATYVSASGLRFADDPISASTRLFQQSKSPPKKALTVPARFPTSHGLGQAQSQEG